MNKIQYLKSVELVFENVESYEVPAIFVKALSLGNLKVNYAFDSVDNGKSRLKLDRNLYADQLSMVLDVSGLDAIKADEYQDDNEDAPSLLKRILQYKDLTALDLHYSNGEEQYVNLYWGMYGDSSNSAMDCTKTIDDELRIEIRPELDINLYKNADDDKTWDKIYRKYKQEMRELYFELKKSIEDEDND